MSAAAELFGSHSHWLAHTLANAAGATSEASCALTNGVRVRRAGIGILHFIPPVHASPDEALIVSAGIHGDETAPVELLNALVDDILSEELSLAIPLLLILGNPPAMVLQRRFVAQNLNRLFAAAHKDQTDMEAERARLIESLCREFAEQHPGALSHYDLHTAIRPSLRERFALYPYCDNGKRPPRVQKDFLLEAEVRTLLLQHKMASTFSSFTANELAAESFTFELGKVHPFGQNDLSRLTALRAALIRRFCADAAPAQARGELETFEVLHEIINTGASFRLHVADDVANFSSYPPGTVIWEDAEQSYRVGAEPEAIVFPNPSVPVGQRAGLMLRCF